MNVLCDDDFTPKPTWAAEDHVDQGLHGLGMGISLVGPLSIGFQHDSIVVVYKSLNTPGQGNHSRYVHDRGAVEGYVDIKRWALRLSLPIRELSHQPNTGVAAIIPTALRNCR